LSRVIPGLPEFQNKLLSAALVLFSLGSNALAQRPADSAPGKTAAPVALVRGWDLDSGPDDGRIHLDVAVTDASGKPVAGLKQSDFTLLDEGHPTPIQSFQAFEAANSDSPTELILVLDQANLNPVNAAGAEHALLRFLRQNGGHLAMPTQIYRYSDSGLETTAKRSSDGNALAEAVEKKHGMTRLWEPRPQYCSGCNGASYYELDPVLNSQQALGSVVLEARRRPGRKIAIWIGYGWPVSDHTNAFSTITEFSTRMREAQMTLYGVSAWADPKVLDDHRPYDYTFFLDGVRTAKEAKFTHLSLDVLATQSGGTTLTTKYAKEADSHVAPEQIDRIVLSGMNTIVAQTGSYYRLSFEPVRTEQVDEYHDLKVEIGQPGLTAHTNTGYYDQPVYYDQPRVTARRLDVAQLESLLEQDHGESDSTLAAELSGMELTERMSSARLTAWKSRLPGKKSWQALVGVADASAFLALPAADVPALPEPSLAERREQLTRIIHYLGELMPTLPNLFATRTTERYEEPKQGENDTWKTARADRALHVEASDSVTVLYRNGGDFEDAATKGHKKPKETTRQLETHGTFGAILAMVMNGAVRGRIVWGGWEKGDSGPVAVFRYAVPQSESRYQVSNCCYPDYLGGGTFELSPAYHGRISFDPATGTILRLTVQPDLTEKMPLIRSDVAVEYGPIQAGGNTYICPVHSVSVLRGRTARPIHQWGETFETYGPFETMLTDVSFRDYHRFGSTSEVLPAFEKVPDPKD
jgi:VWFA-related protein